jgi:hypothetical protein
MAFQRGRNFVKETTTVTGTGAATLLGARSPARTFNSVLANGDTCRYAISHTTLNEWETGIGTWTTTGTILTRTTPQASSNSGAAVSFSAGTKNVDMVWGQEDMDDTVLGVSSNTTVTSTTSTTNISCGGVFTIGGGSLRVGSVYRITAKYVYVHTAAVTPTVIIEVLIAGAVVDTITIVPIATAGTYTGSVEALIRCQALGSGTTGKVLVTMDQWNTYASSLATQGGGTTAGVTVAAPAGVPDNIDTTIDRTLELRMRLSATLANNTLSCTQGFVEKVMT